MSLNVSLIMLAYVLEYVCECVLYGCVLQAEFVSKSKGKCSADIKEELSSKDTYMYLKLKN